MYEYWGKNRIVEIGYCEIQCITNLLNARHYTCGVYGWNADIYEFEKFAICTGYRPFGTYNTKLVEYCERWNKIIKETPYEKKRSKLKRFENGLFKLLVEVTK